MTNTEHSRPLVVGHDVPGFRLGMMLAVALLVAFMLISWFGSAVAIRLPAGPVDPTGEARAAAMAELDRIRDVGWYGFADASAMKSAWLGEPYVAYWTDWAFTEFEKAESDSILMYVARYAVFFPVHVEGRVLGSINVREQDGRWLFTSASIGDSQCVRVAETRSRLKLQPSERLSVLLIQMTGTFYIIENGTRISQMAQYPVRGAPTREEMGQEPPPQFQPAESFIASIKEDIRRYRDRITDPRNQINLERRDDE